MYGIVHKAASQNEFLIICESLLSATLDDAIGLIVSSVIRFILQGRNRVIHSIIAPIIVVLYIRWFDVYRR